MTPQSPTIQPSHPHDFDEFASVPPTEPNLTQLSSGEVEVAVAAAPEEADSISLGDVDASHISAASHNQTLVIPNAPVSRNLTDAFENCEQTSGVLSTPSSTEKGGDSNHSTNAGVGEGGDANDGSSPAGVDQLNVEGLSIKNNNSGKSPSKSKQHHHQQQRSAVRTPRANAQSAPVKTSPSPKITVLGETIPFSLHPVLALDLPAPTVNRVSFYSIIHDINKESTDMAANDSAGNDAAAGRRNRSSSMSGSVAGSMSTISAASSNVGDHPVNEEFSPLVIAVNGPPPGPPLAPTMSKISTATTAASSTLTAGTSSSALIDEEKWLLRAISSRSVSEIEYAGGSCPTFAQAIGEQDSIAADDNSSTGGGSQQAPNPMTDLSQSRTQLWKPSRSWWEAKSGKNPWIEPNSHNKRWRYLWPLIHYHKFLAKCIKKLKHNGVDVKNSVSPVSAFLRSEVCAVSDHLARCSYFSSEEWMGALYFFEGWADASPEAEVALRNLIHKQELRPLAEQADTESPLLRDQIDVRFLKAMAAARAKQPPSAAVAIAASAAIAAGKTPVGRPPKAPAGGGLPRPAGRPPVPSISTASQQKQPGSSRKRRGRRGGRGSSSRGSDNDLSLSSHSRASSFGGGEDDEEGAAWNGIPTSSPSPHPPSYGGPGDMSLMHGGNNGGYGQMPPPYGNPYGMSYGHNPYYHAPPHHAAMGMAAPMGQQGPPGFYGQHANPHWAGQGPPPGYGQPPHYSMHGGDPNMSLDNSFHGGMMMPPHPQVPGTPDQSLDHGNPMDVSMASPAWAHLDRLATGVIATPMTNRTGKHSGRGARANIKNAVAGAARSLVFGDGNAAAAKEKGGVPPSPATMFAASKSPAPQSSTNPADVTTTTVDIPTVSRTSPAPSVAPSDEVSEAPSSN